MIGADLATARDRSGFRGEVGYVHTDNPNGRRLDAITPHLGYVLGIERSLDRERSASAAGSSIGSTPTVRCRIPIPSAPRRSFWPRRRR